MGLFIAGCAAQLHHALHCCGVALPSEAALCLSAVYTNFRPNCLHRFNRIQEEAGIKSKKQKGADGLAEDAAAALSKSGGMANLLDELLEGDFDPDAYDKRMAAAFDDDYYEVRAACIALHCMKK